MEAGAGAGTGASRKRHKASRDELEARWCLVCGASDPDPGDGSPAGSAAGAAAAAAAGGARIVWRNLRNTRHYANIACCSRCVYFVSSAAPADSVLFVEAIERTLARSLDSKKRHALVYEARELQFALRHNIEPREIEGRIDVRSFSLIDNADIVLQRDDTDEFSVEPRFSQARLETRRQEIARLEARHSKLLEAMQRDDELEASLIDAWLRDASVPIDVDLAQHSRRFALYRQHEMALRSLAGVVEVAGANISHLCNQSSTSVGATLAVLSRIARFGAERARLRFDMPTHLTLFYDDDGMGPGAHEGTPRLAISVAPPHASDVSAVLFARANATVLRRRSLYRVYISAVFEMARDEGVVPRFLGSLDDVAVRGSRIRFAAHSLVQCVSRVFTFDTHALERLVASVFCDGNVEWLRMWVRDSRVDSAQDDNDNNTGLDEAARLRLRALALAPSHTRDACLALFE